MPTFVRIMCAHDEQFLVEMYKLSVSDLLTALLHSDHAGTMSPTELAPSTPDHPIIFPITVNLPLRATTVALVLRWIDEFFAVGQYDYSYIEGIAPGQSAPFHLAPWVTEFFQDINPDNIARLSTAADFLGIGYLQDMANKTMANLISTLDMHGLHAFILELAPHTVDEFI